MKLKILFLLIFILSLASVVTADIIPMNSHPLDKCVTITNLDQFSDVYLIGYVKGPMPIAPYIIEPNVCLSKGCKFNSFTISASPKEYIDTLNISEFNPYAQFLPDTIKERKSNIITCYYDEDKDQSPCYDNIEGWYKKQLTDENVVKSNIEINPYGGYISNLNPAISLDEEYTIAGFQGSQIIIYKSREKVENEGLVPDTDEQYISPLTGVLTYTFPKTNYSYNTDVVEIVNNTRDVHKAVYTPSKKVEEKTKSKFAEFITALIFTLIIEVSLLLIYLKKIVKTKLKTLDIVAVGIIATSVTLPILWFIIPKFIPWYFYIYIGELFVIIVETLIYKFMLKLKWKHVILISFIANLISVLLGILIF